MTYTNKGKVRAIRAWAIIDESGNLAHHYNAHAVYAKKKDAEIDLFGDGSDRLVRVEIRPVNNPPTKRK